MAIHLYLDEALTQQISEGDFSRPEAESYNGTDGDIKDRQLYVANEQTSLASAIDLAHFAEALLDSYHGRGGPVSPAGIRQLWWATSDLGCYPNCPYERYYGVGFFTDTLPGNPVIQVGHGGARPGYATGFVLRPESDSAACVLANADVSTVKLSNLAKAILDDFAD